MTAPSERNRDRLPKWARDELDRLERTVDWWKAKATAGPDESDTFVDEITMSGADPAFEGRPLGIQPTVRFGPRADRLSVEVTRRDDGSVDARVPDGQVAVYSYSSNQIRIRGVPWRET